MAADFWISPWALGLLGLCVGSFLNVVIHRLPRMLDREWLSGTADYLQDAKAVGRVLPASRVDDLTRFGKRLADDCAALPPLGLARPRSRCPHCGHAIRWFENLPLLSWLALRGKCSACGAGIAGRYPLVEGVTALLFAATAWVFGPSSTSLVYALAIALLIAAALVDLDTTLLPDELTFPLAGLGLLAAALQWTPVSLADAAIGLLAGYLALWSVATLFRLLRGQRGMAEGDFRLLAGLGALLGWQQLLPIILLSSLVGAAVGVFLVLARQHRREVPIPFGPYLAGGGLAALFFGPQLLQLLLPTLRA